MDVHSPFTTVSEAIAFSAGLRLPTSITAQARDASVEVSEYHTVCLNHQKSSHAKRGGNGWMRVLTHSMTI